MPAVKSQQQFSFSTVQHKIFWDGKTIRHEPCFFATTKVTRNVGNPLETNQHFRCEMACITTVRRSSILIHREVVSGRSDFPRILPKLTAKSSCRTVLDVRKFGLIPFNAPITLNDSSKQMKEMIEKIINFKMFDGPKGFTSKSLKDADEDKAGLRSRITTLQVGFQHHRFVDLSQLLGHCRWPRGQS